LEKISKIFNDFDIQLLGCTTAGEIAGDALYANSIVCLLIEIDRSFFKVVLYKNTEGIEANGYEVRKFADAAFTNPAMIVCAAGFSNDGEQIITGLKRDANREIPIFGALAADNLSFVNTFAFTNHDCTHDGLAAVVFDNDKIELKGLATSGWEPLGVYNTVTKAEGNKIYTINNEPALDYFTKFFGEHEIADVDTKLATLPAQYPLQVCKKTDYTVLRSPIYGDKKERSLTLAGAINTGDKFRFSISPGLEVIEKTVNEFKEFKENAPKPEALVLFSCKGRHAALGPFIEDEIKGIYDTWNKPMIGFLSYGEIGNMENGICEFHNETCCLVLLREK
jgi:hypothetical protein